MRIDPMNKLCGATAIAIALGFAAPAMAASEAACKAMWSKTDANNSGYISGKEAAIFMSAMIMNGSDRPPSSGPTRMLV